MNQDQTTNSEPGSDRIVFDEHGIQHTFQPEGAGRGTEHENAFLRLNFVTVYVSNQELSKRFFLDQVGFTLMIDVCFPSGHRWIEVSPPDGSARIALVRPAPGFMEEALPGQSSFITFMTDDVEARYREWSARGVRFTLPPHTPEWGGLFCRFEDMDGNQFGLAGFNEVAQQIERRRRVEAKRREAERLAAQELEIAKQVQARLLSQRPPPVSTLDCAGICVQARAVGGDYYDFLDLGKDRMAIIVGDIAGKGIAAALLMANLQVTVRSQTAQIADYPEQAFTLVNRMLFESTEPGAYATLFYSEYDSRSGRLRYVNCGHLPGLLFRGNTIEKLDAANTVIGLFESWKCTVSEASMAGGDLLVLYTDGVTEAFDDSGEQFGEARLIEAVQKNRDLPSRQLAGAIVDQVASFGDGQQSDDVTVVVAKRIG